MLLRRTPKGQRELQSRERGLSLRERGILFLADGTKTLASVDVALGATARVQVALLVEAGYLELLPQALPTAAPRRPETSVPQIPAAAAPTPAPHQADAMSGRRSLAATRMFLFDLCERTFARGAPGKADRFRERLRHARDGRAMLSVAEDMVDEIGALAGWERAYAVRERIEALLPDLDEA